MNSKVYSMDFSRGALVPLENPGLPLGAVVYYEDRANPRQDYAVVTTGRDAAGVVTEASQVVRSLEDGHRSEISFAGGKICGHWKVTDRVLSDDELRAALALAEANGKRMAEEAAAAAAQAAKQAAEDRARWDVEFSYLQKPGPKLSIHACGAKNIKKELARAFPGIEFRCKSDSFSGGSSIDVYWELGPTTEQVEAITGKYQYGHFNGMEDIYEYNRSQWPEIYGGAKYVSENRQDDGDVDTVAAAFCREHGIAIPADNKWWTVYPGNDHCGHDVGVIARQLLFDQSYPAGAVVTGIERQPEDKQNGKWTGLWRVTYTVPEVKPAMPQEEASTPPAVVPGAGDFPAVKFNHEKNGVELHFPSKPAAEVLEQLKRAGWRWSRFNACWYIRRTSQAVTLAARLGGLTDAQAAALFGGGPVAIVPPDAPCPVPPSKAEVIAEMTRNFCAARAGRATLGGAQ